MIPYILVLFFTIFWIYLEKRALNRTSFFVPLFILSCFAGMRLYSIGTDSVEYTLPFRSNDNSAYFVYNDNLEFGYQFFIKLLLSFTHDYSIYFFIVAFVVVFLNLFIIKKYSINYIFSFYIYFVFGFYTALFNPIRQYIAMAIVFMALPFLLRKKILPYSLIIILASTFHISALIMIPIYFLIRSGFRVEFKFIICLLSSFLGSSVVIKFMAEDNDRYSNYNSVYSANGNGYMTVLFYLLLGIFIYIFGRRIRKNNKEYSVFEQLFICGIGLLLPLTLLGTDPSGPQRIVSYFVWFLILLLPYTFSKINNKFILWFFIFLSFIYFNLITYYFGNMYPYEINPNFMIF